MTLTQIWLIGLFLSLPLFFLATRKVAREMRDLKLYHPESVLFTITVAAVILSCLWPLSVPLSYKSLFEAVKTWVKGSK